MAQRSTQKTQVSRRIFAVLPLFAGSGVAALWRMVPYLVLIGVIGLLLRDALFFGKGLVPADGLLSFLPWSRTWQSEPSNHLLTDQFAYILPVREFIHDQILRGRLALWNPHLGAGMPSLASMQVAVLYPINLLLAPLSPFTASGIAAFLKLLLCGVFTMLYMRRLGVLPAAALLSSLVFALCGFIVVWLGHPHTNAAVVLPALLYFIETQFRASWDLRSWVGSSVAFGMMLLGGHLPTAVHVTLAITLYFTVRLAEPGRTDRLARCLLFAGALVAGGLIAAPQLFPYLEYYRVSSSALSSAALERWSSHLTANTLFHFVLPFLSGSPQAGFEDLPRAMGLGNIMNFNERTGYVGILTLFLAGVAITARRCRISVIYGGAALTALLVVYGVPPWPSVMRSLPVMNSVNHMRLLLVVDWSLAVLAGLGLDHLLRAANRTTHRFLAIGFGVCMAIVLGALWIRIGDGVGQLSSAARAFVINQLWIPAGGVVVGSLITMRWFPAHWVPAACVLWTAVDLLWFAGGYNPAIPAQQYFPVTESIRFLQRDASVFRIVGLSSVLPPNSAAAYGLDDIRGQDFTTVRRYEELITGRAGDFFFFQKLKERPPSIDLLDVKYVLTPEPLPAVPEGYELVHHSDIAIYRDNRARERALIAFRYQVLEDRDAVLAAVRSGAFDPGELALFEEDVVPAGGEPDPAISSARARILSYEPDRVAIEALLPRAGFLVLLDNYFPGWKAYVDDRETPIHRADYTFRAVALPPGKHNVEFVYRPASFTAGVATAAGVFLLLMTVLAVGGARGASGFSAEAG